MSWFTFVIAEILGALLVGGFAFGLIGIVPAFLVMIGMLALSFHVMARDPRPDGTSIRMACFATALWYATILGGTLFLEMRAWPITIAALLFTLFTGVLTAFAVWSIIERPLDYDVDEVE
jgi:hypothetical protein